MVQDKTALMPSDKKYAVTNGAQFPNITVKMFDIWFACQFPVLSEDVYIVLYFFSV